MVDPRREPCQLCGREAEECVCALAPDLSDYFDPLDENSPDEFRVWTDDDEEELQ